MAFSRSSGGGFRRRTRPLSGSDSWCRPQLAQQTHGSARYCYCLLRYEDYFRSLSRVQHHSIDFQESILAASYELTTEHRYSLLAVSLGPLAAANCSIRRLTTAVSKLAGLQGDLRTSWRFADQEDSRTGASFQLPRRRTFCASSPSPTCKPEPLSTQS